MKRGTFVLLVMLVIMVAPALPLIPMTTWSNSGSLKSLRANGTIRIIEDELYYTHNSGAFLSTEELKALKKLSKEYRIKIEEL